MALELNLKRVLSFFVVALLSLVGIGIYFGFHLHRQVSAQAELRSQYLRDSGNAPPAVREGVVEELRGFQDGYIRRDPLTLDAFMSRHFENNDDILVLGAGPSEWARGYAGVSNFIRADWSNWGDLRLNVESPMVSSYGDVAWVATAGTVHFKLRDRPVRISAILTRHGDKWLFRQMHFQYEDGDESLLGLSLRR